MSISARLKYSTMSALKLNEQQTAIRDRIRDGMEQGTYPVKDVPCFCGEDGGTIIAERDRYGLPVRTVLCMNCGIMRTSPRMTDDAASQFYREDYRGLYSGSRSMEELFTSDVERGKWLVQEMPSLMAQVETIFDIGCGTGGMLLPLKKAGKTVIGCDVHDEYLNIGRTNGLELVCGGPADIVAHTGKQADLVLLSHVVEHFHDIRTELEETIQVLRPGGWLLVQLPGIRAIPVSEYAGNFLLYLQNAHNYHFTAATIDFVLKSVGLNVISAEEQIVAAAVRPEGWSSGAPMAPVPEGEALSILSFLADLERRFLFGIEEEMSAPEATPTADDGGTGPWPLATDASLRVLAWPKYDDPESLIRVLTVAEPLWGNPDACLCLRYDPDVDIPYDEATVQLERAYEKIPTDGDLNVLIVDDKMSPSDLPRLGMAVTCVLQTDPEIDEARSEFVSALGIEIISGK